MAAINNKESEARLESFVRWLQPRAAAVRELHMAVVPPAVEPDGGAAYRRMYAMMTRGLTTVAPGLERLHLEWLGHLRIPPIPPSRLTRLRQANLFAETVDIDSLCSATSLKDLWVIADEVGMSHQAYAVHPGGTQLNNLANPQWLPDSLTGLSFSRAKMKSLPPGLDRLPALRSLDISYAFPRTGPDFRQVALLTTLRELTCSWCRLGTVPRELSALTNLRVLYLHDCLFHNWEPSEQEWTAALGPLRALGMLSLSSCNLTRVPGAGLHLEGSRLQQLPPGPYLSRLVELVLDWSCLLASHTVLSRHATQLTKLYASGAHRLPRGGGAAAADAALDGGAVGGAELAAGGGAPLAAAQAAQQAQPAQQVLVAQQADHEQAIALQEHVAMLQQQAQQAAVQAHMAVLQQAQQAAFQANVALMQQQAQQAAVQQHMVPTMSQLLQGAAHVAASHAQQQQLILQLAVQAQQGGAQSQQLTQAAAQLAQLQEQQQQLLMQAAQLALVAGGAGAQGAAQQVPAQQGAVPAVGGQGAGAPGVLGGGGEGALVVGGPPADVDQEMAIAEDDGGGGPAELDSDEDFPASSGDEEDGLGDDSDELDSGSASDLGEDSEDELASEAESQLEDDSAELDSEAESGLEDNSEDELGSEAEGSSGSDSEAGSDQLDSDSEADSGEEEEEESDDSDEGGWEGQSDEEGGVMGGGGAPMPAAWHAAPHPLQLPPPLPAQRHPTLAADVAASLAALPALAHFVDVFPPEGKVALDPQAASLMYLLPRRCPRLEVSVLQSNSFGWRLADLEQRERQGG
ncbi:hypothetical protein N2152v2_011102 [Parachlorella kessleri]